MEDSTGSYTYSEEDEIRILPKVLISYANACDRKAEFVDCDFTKVLRLAAKVIKERVKIEKAGE